eukprot:TRINITY_DN8097_c0_g2_i1.p1 TRINITY_DN8097_c0_g2~~TRINITY_DN8097_c0_g2_i1.p1  ORF type:complete len:290 (-),score=53.02 TRINITY_DN8097_c0_g2_i1:74-943(-)
MQPHSSLWWRVVALCLVICVVLVGLNWSSVEHFLSAFLQWVARHPLLGSCSYVVVYALGSTVFVPGSILSLGAGFVFYRAFPNFTGVLIGVGVVLAGAQLGSMLSFLLARSILREWIEKRLREKAEQNIPIYVKFQVIDTVLGNQGIKTVACLRLTPLIPFNLLNFLFGISSVSPFDLFAGNMFMIPGIVAYVLIGTSLGSISDAVAGHKSAVSGNRWLVGLTVAGTIVSLGIAAFLSWAAKEEIERVLESNKGTDSKGKENSSERSSAPSPENSSRSERDSLNSKKIT